MFSQIRARNHQRRKRRITNKTLICTLPRLEWQQAPSWICAALNKHPSHFWTRGWCWWHNGWRLWFLWLDNAVMIQVVCLSVHPSTEASSIGVSRTAADRQSQRHSPVKGLSPSQEKWVKGCPNVSLWHSSPLQSILSFLQILQRQHPITKSNVFMRQSLATVGPDLRLVWMVTAQIPAELNGSCFIAVITFCNIKPGWKQKMRERRHVYLTVLA